MCDWFLYKKNVNQNKPKQITEFLQLLGRLIAQYGKCLRVWLGTQLIVLITDPKDIEVSRSLSVCSMWVGIETGQAKRAKTVQTILCNGGIRFVLSERKQNDRVNRTRIANAVNDRA